MRCAGCWGTVYQDAPWQQDGGRYFLRHKDPESNGLCGSYAGDQQTGELGDAYGAVVSVTRKLYRSGDSEYRINGKNVRLKDVTELFMDTGMGRDGYAIIGQGRIAEIVSAKSTDRRDIFEEAAGVSKFRYKKQEAQRKLDAAQENLVRLQDIVMELESRVEPLRQQAEKAKQYVELAGEQKQLEVSLWVRRLTALGKSLPGCRTAISRHRRNIRTPNGRYSGQMPRCRKAIAGCRKAR